MWRKSLFSRWLLKSGDNYLDARRWAAIHMSMRDIAKQAGVSQPSVLRFCRILGYNGYVEFKLAVAAGFKRADAADASLQPSLTDGEHLWPQVVSTVFRLVRAMRQHASDGEVERAVNWLLSAHRIEFIGLEGAAALYEPVRVGFLERGISIFEVREPDLMRPTLQTKVTSAWC